MVVPRATSQARKPLLKRALAVGLFFGLLTPASPQFLALPKASEDPSPTDKAHMEWLLRAWSQTADSEKANWAWFAETWPQVDSVDRARRVWLEGKWANADENERAHWAWLGGMWARARSLTA
jgi:hypothetical protein